MEKPKKKQVLLFYCVESQDLARQVAAQSDLIQLQSINWRSCLVLHVVLRACELNFVLSGTVLMGNDAVCEVMGISTIKIKMVNGIVRTLGDVRKVWVYFMKHKSEVFNVLKQWKARVENQTGKKLKYFRSDNGMEYKDEEFLQFCKDKGIIRHFSNEERSKLDPKSKECIFLGHEEGVKGYKLWDLVVKKWVISRDLIFNEAQMLDKDATSSERQGHTVEIELHEQRTKSTDESTDRSTDEQSLENSEEHPSDSWNLSKSHILHLKKLLSREFDMKDLGSAKKILGREIHRDRKAGKLWITQKSYFEKVLERRSTTGYIFKFYGGPICWKSVLQSTTALSTTEVEYVALTEAANEALWLKGLVEELGFKQCGVLLQCDSQSAMDLAKNQRNYNYIFACIRSFDDGFPNLFINDAQDIRGQHVAFLASFSSPGVIFEQLSVIFALPRLFVASFTLVLPFFPTGSFERMEEEGDVATAFTMARILSNIPISRGGPTSLVIYDIHALQERFYFGDHVLPCFETGIPLLKQRLHQLPDAKNASTFHDLTIFLLLSSFLRRLPSLYFLRRYIFVCLKHPLSLIRIFNIFQVVVAFPDDGAWKRFHKQLDHFPMVVCAKVREGDKRIVRIKEGNPSGCHVVIVDDLVQSGGTLIECQKVLATHGAAKVSAYVTHAVFPKSSWERFVHKNDEISEKAFAYFWITNSCPLTVKAIANKAPFEVLSLAVSISDALQI
ncbi:hypothetical protein RJ639_028530 [Escallonia herrerae]|uniref:ribose-phosphate diphosphokinase n=1 Tax=Escallonia herrerae TaxID=1293975 RepID=A0AA88X5N8_9ASTE|nr:hypothetical protein RJ639_028530 [Escallonia herrerae]